MSPVVTLPAFRIAVSVLFFGGLCLFAASDALAGKPVYVGGNVPAERRVSMDRYDHAAWDALLTKYVDTAGNVDYTAWKRSPEDIRALEGYLGSLSYAGRGIRASREATMAYWINAYNAVTVKGILREYPTSSIRNHTSKAFGYNIWKDLQLVVDGAGISLEDIEHKVLRKMNEPRIHFAIVCASKSCPRLLNRAYTAADLEKQLSTSTRAFFASGANFRYDAGSGKMQLSTILKWFASDFGRDQAAQLKTIAPYLPTKAAWQAANAGRVRVSHLDYDWSLNDQATARRSVRR